MNDLCTVAALPSGNGRVGPAEVSRLHSGGLLRPKVEYKIERKISTEPPSDYKLLMEAARHVLNAHGRQAVKEAIPCAKISDVPADLMPAVTHTLYSRLHADGLLWPDGPALVPIRFMSRVYLNEIHHSIVVNKPDDAVILGLTKAEWIDALSTEYKRRA